MGHTSKTTASLSRSSSIRPHCEPLFPFKMCCVFRFCCLTFRRVLRVRMIISNVAKRWIDLVSSHCQVTIYIRKMSTIYRRKNPICSLILHFIGKDFLEQRERTRSLGPFRSRVVGGGGGWWSFVKVSKQILFCLGSFDPWV